MVASAKFHVSVSVQLIKEAAILWIIYALSSLFV